ncbi:hypothetical protein PMAYCL1PPCAC_17682, partial [Pristionchus mayeri]
MKVKDQVLRFDRPISLDFQLVGKFRNRIQRMGLIFTANEIEVNGAHGEFHVSLINRSVSNFITQMIEAFGGMIDWTENGLKGLISFHSVHMSQQMAFLTHGTEVGGLQIIVEAV